MTTHTDLIKRLREWALPDPHDEREVIGAPLLRRAANALADLERQVAALTKERDHLQSLTVVNENLPVPALRKQLAAAQAEVAALTLELDEAGSNCSMYKQQVLTLTKEKEAYKQASYNIADILAEVTKERDKAESLRADRDSQQRVCIAAQALESKLRGHMFNIASACRIWGGEAERARKLLEEALALPADDSALMERLKEERERCAVVCDEFQKTSYLSIGTTLARMIRELP